MAGIKPMYSKTVMDTTIVTTNDVFKNLQKLVGKVLDNNSIINAFKGHTYEGITNIIIDKYNIDIPNTYCAYIDHNYSDCFIIYCNTDKMITGIELF